MKITIESTTAIVTINDGIQCRVWEGHTESGIKVEVLIPRIAARKGQDLSQFEAELQEQAPPSADALFPLGAFPLRLIL